jgi:hypothetical protein
MIRGMTASNAPVLLLAHRRPDHTRRVLDALLANPEAPSTDLIVNVDGPRSPEESDLVNGVADLCGKVRGFRSVKVHRSMRNIGLAASVVTAVTRELDAADSLIVVEDDVVVATGFLAFMNEALRTYVDEPLVAGVSGYVFPLGPGLPETFFVRGADCWGWGTWRRAWSHFESDGRVLLERLASEDLGGDFDFSGTAHYTDMLRAQVRGENDSWAVRWYASAFLDGMLTLYPYRSLVHNIGLDGSGHHGSRAAREYDTPEAVGQVPVTWQEPRELPEARRAFTAHMRRLHGRSPWERARDGILRRFRGA